MWCFSPNPFPVGLHLNVIAVPKLGHWETVLRAQAGEKEQGECLQGCLTRGLSICCPQNIKRLLHKACTTEGFSFSATRAGSRAGSPPTPFWPGLIPGTRGHFSQGSQLFSCRIPLGAPFSTSRGCFCLLTANLPRLSLHVFPPQLFSVSAFLKLMNTSSSTQEGLEQPQGLKGAKSHPGGWHTVSAPQPSASPCPPAALLSSTPCNKDHTPPLPSPALHKTLSP